MISPENAYELIKSRRSIYPKWFTSEAIDKETILNLLEVANWAPTHKMTEPWRFIVFHSQPSRMGLSEFLGEYYIKHTSIDKFSALKHRKTLEKPLQSAVVIAIVMQRDPAESLPEWEELAATACAVENLWIAATAAGIGGYWSSPASMQSEDAANFLELKSGEKCLGVFYLGRHRMPEAPRVRKNVEEKIRWK